MPDSIAGSLVVLPPISLRSNLHPLAGPLLSKIEAWRRLHLGGLHVGARWIQSSVIHPVAGAAVPSAGLRRSLWLKKAEVALLRLPEYNYSQVDGATNTMYSS